MKRIILKMRFRGLTIVFFLTILMPLFSPVSLYAMAPPPPPPSTANTGNTWYFGTQAGIDFNGGGAPVAVLDGAMSQFEGCASISDSTGSILFYTNGQTVYNKNHLTMTNGTGLLGHQSSTQSAMIVPKPGSSTIYYIFTIWEKGSQFNYSEVDMTLSGGLGSVTVKNTLLFANVCEKITAVRSANCADIWIIVHQWNSDAFRAYTVSPAGVNAVPVISNSGITISGSSSRAIGQMKVSPDGTRLGIAHDYLNNAQLFDFDDATGVVSNPITLSTSYPNFGPYGLEFSPNSQVLYIVPEGGGNQSIFQYDMNAGNIPLSQTIVGTTGGYGSGLQLGPDGKIYVAKAGQTSLTVINDPNVIGPGCNIVNSAINLLGRLCRFGLPALIQSSLFTTNKLGSDTTYCMGDTLLLDVTTLNATYLWQDNSTNPTFNVTTPGTYTVEITLSCTVIYDTINLIPCPLPIELLYFKATAETNELVRTEWKTATETNNDYFTIEHSQNGCDFEPIGTVDGAGNSTQALTYTYAVGNPYFPFSYYRLKQTDFDGRFAYSSIVAVKTGKQQELEITGIYPNPTSDYFFFTYKGGSLSVPLSVTVLSAVTGREVLHREFAGLSGSSQRVRIRNLNKGIYYVKFTSEQDTHPYRLVVK